MVRRLAGKISEMKLLVIGCGSIGGRHALNAQKFAETAVVDINADYASERARQLGASYFGSLGEALEWKPDGAVIATPTCSHADIAKQCIQAGIPVLIEKPLADTPEKAEELLCLVKETNIKSYVVCNMRFHPAVKALRDNLKHIGRPYYARAHFGNYLPNMRPAADYSKLYCASRKMGGGLILDCIHEIDYLMHFFGPVTSVKSACARLSDLKIDVEDYANLTLMHKRGVISEIHFDYLRPFKRRGCEITGEAGMLLWQSEGKAPESCRVQMFLKETEKWRTLFESDKMDHNKPLYELMQGFVSAVNNGAASDMLDVFSAYDELKIAYKATEEGLMDE